MIAVRTFVPLAAAALLAGCGAEDRPSLPQGSEPANLDPANFQDTIDHPYWPMQPGTAWVYSERDLEGSRQRVVVTVTEQTKEISGIRARVVHDVVTKDGAVVEDTYDWYAQDKDGNLWYLGEDTKEYEDGKVASTAGSWQAGVDGAEPGLILPAKPSVGMTLPAGVLQGRGRGLGGSSQPRRVDRGSRRRVQAPADDQGVHTPRA